MSRRRREMYCDHARLCVCMCVCVSVCPRPHAYTIARTDWRSGRGCPLVVHYWADLQSVHGLRCYGNTRNAWQSPAVIRQAHRTPHAVPRTIYACRRNSPRRRQNRRACCVHRSISSILQGCCNRARNVSEYMLVLASKPSL